jgi:hypothetical protein
MPLGIHRGRRRAVAAVRLVAGIIGAVKFSTDANILLASGGAIWLSNVIAFGLWYWDLDRGGAAARARGSRRQPAAYVASARLIPSPKPKRRQRSARCRPRSAQL